ncbi:hypothetical protein EFK50_16400 [Nocardioides marmoriginsengisoli]|uniref:PBP domain-containing protein n=1 Tax=Nocardioides marmoriginsengisoli TaxID=661483 RepID=A0A3N0CIV8_9ACTN|nr:hypothetical protein [Nocardioides marmoriginsengisoli]RNL63269.1 hypothetical protein EFK50_16400 [Nocardioides marmoriginsengisoli]
MIARRALAAGVALGAVLVSLIALGTPTGAVAAEDDGSLTVTGAGRFEDLKVTISQHTHLRNQVIRVSWTGGEQSTTSGRNFFNNYLQIMQCWGDESGPKREKCQYGGIFDDPRGGASTSTREILNDGQHDDPDETYTAPFPKTALVPFESVTGKVVTTRRNEFFDTQSTNEIDYGRTSNDGTGEEFFEVQTGREAAGLGCGVVKDDGDPRDCWLVVVPRDTKEVTGADVSETPSNRLETSPLAASNFAHAISFRLKFDPVGTTCSIDSAERRVLGNESAAEAVGQWQPELCDATGANFGYSQIADQSARAQALTETPWLSLVNRPLDADLNSDGRLLAYAPVAVNAVGIGVVVERVPKDGPYDPDRNTGSTPEVKAKRGTRVLDVKLNARLVAKLLTQSYLGSITGSTAHVAGNPRSLTDDKEFLALNPEFNQLQYIGQLYSITNPLGLADANRSIWEWIKSDPAARAFIAGTPAKVGGQTVKVNPFYKGMDLDRQDFPRSDPTCVKFPAALNQADFCALDHLAYAADFHSASRGAIRGMTLANDTWDLAAIPPRYKQNPAQAPGERAVLVLTDTATAARFKLSMAKLQNASGAFISPTNAGMSAALGAMKPSGTAGVLAANPGTKVKAAYPLTEVTYAMTAPRQLKKDEAADYAGFVKYAGGPGQTPGISPGELPEGYLPLPAAMRKQALATAALIAKQGGPLPAAEPTAKPTEEGDGGTSTPETETPVTEAPVGAPAPPGGTAVAPVPAAVTPASVTTKGIEPGATRYVLLIALLLGVLALSAKPATFAYAAVQKLLHSRPDPRSP